MVRCDEFYAKWERCGNFCEKHPDTAEEIENYLDFIEEIENRAGISEQAKKAIAGASEGALRPLIRERDNQIRQEAISTIEKALNYHNPPSSLTKKKITEKDTTNAIIKAQKKISGEKEVKTINEVQEPINIATSVIFTCPVCEKEFELFHIEPDGTHQIVDTEQRNIIVSTRVTDEIDELFDYLAEKLDTTRSTLLHELIIERRKLIEKKLL